MSIVGNSGVLRAPVGLEMAGYTYGAACYNPTRPPPFLSCLFSLSRITRRYRGFPSSFLLASYLFISFWTSRVRVLGVVGSLAGWLVVGWLEWWESIYNS